MVLYMYNARVPGIEKWLNIIHALESVFENWFKSTDGRMAARVRKCVMDASRQTFPESAIKLRYADDRKADCL